MALPPAKWAAYKYTIVHAVLPQAKWMTCKRHTSLFTQFIDKGYLWHLQIISHHFDHRNFCIMRCTGWILSYRPFKHASAIRLLWACSMERNGEVKVGDVMLGVMWMERWDYYFDHNNLRIMRCTGCYPIARSNMHQPCTCFGSDGWNGMAKYLEVGNVMLGVRVMEAKWKKRWVSSARSGDLAILAILVT